MSFPLPFPFLSFPFVSVSSPFPSCLSPLPFSSISWTWKLANLETCEPGSLRTWKLANLETYEPPLLRTWKFANVETYEPGNSRTWKLANLETCEPGSLRTWKLANLEACEPGNLRTWKLANMETCEPTPRHAVWVNLTAPKGLPLFACLLPRTQGYPTSTARICCPSHSSSTSRRVSGSTWFFSRTLRAEGAT